MLTHINSYLVILPSTFVNKLDHSYIEAYKNCLTKNIYSFWVPAENAKLARIYFLKKIHKNPQGIRPIVSCCQSSVSQFVDYWLQPHVKTLPSFLRDSSQFIAKIEQLDFPPNSLLVTIDVTSLYTKFQIKKAFKPVTKLLFH